MNEAFDNERLRKEAREMHNENRRWNESIELADGVKNAENRSRQMMGNTLYVGNLPYRADALKVVEVLARACASFETGVTNINMLSDLTSSFYDVSLDCYGGEKENFPIVKCVLPKPPRRRNPYYAIVAVASDEIKQRLLLLSQVTIYGRVVRIDTAINTFYHDPTAFRTKIVDVKLGMPILNYLSRTQQDSYNYMYKNKSEQPLPYWESYWNSEEHHFASSIEINGLARIIAFEFLRSTNRYRVEVNMHHLDGGIQVEKSGDNSKDAATLVLVLKVPPAIFRYAGVIEANINTESSIDFPVLSEGIKNSLVWQLGGASSQDDKEWIRTIDVLSPNNAFASCMVYKVNLHRRTSRAIIDYIQMFQLRSERTMYNMAIQNVTRSSLSNGVGWSGNSFSDKLFDLLPFTIKYLIHCLVSQNRLKFLNHEELTNFVDLINSNQELATCALVQMERYWNQLFYLEPYNNLRTWMLQYSRNHSAAQESFKCGLYVKSITITPLRVVCRAPQLSQSNRVLRENPELQERLVRVTFADEAYGPFHKAMSSDVLELRMRRLLKDGINISGQQFRFLGYSNSQLRTVSCWVYNDSRDENNSNIPSVEDLRNKLGNFDLLRCRPSRYGARLGQCFSDVLIAKAIQSTKWKVEKDIIKNNFCFSDGVGTISKELSKILATELGYNYIPGAFQVRFAGFKGVLTTSEIQPGDNGQRFDIVFRESMKKFDSPSQYLEVVAISTYIASFLNRQIIVLLSDLGVPDNVFLTMQEDMISDLAHILSDINIAKTFVSSIQIYELNYVTNVVTDLLNAGFDPQSNSFLANILHTLREIVLRDIINRSRILIKDGVVLMGVLDETNSLKSGEIFVKYIDPFMGRTKIIEGEVIAGRNPSLHPGDIRRVKAVNAKPLHHLINVVVFSSEGDRPLPSMMSGGDLDGDIYFVIWDERLFPKLQEKPLSYASIGKTIDPVNASDVVDWFVKFTENDRLGLIADAHLIHADAQCDGSYSEICLELARLHSIAVDFAKTGKPATLPRELRPPVALPDFKQNNRRPMYESKKVLGQLYRAAKWTSFFKPSVTNVIDDHLLLSDRTIFLAEAIVLRMHYEHELSSIMYQYGINEEGEVCSGLILSFHRGYDQSMSRKHQESITERVRLSYKKLRDDFRKVFWEELDEYFDKANIDEDTNLRKSLANAKASAWYASVFERDNVDDQCLMSFGFLMHELLCDIKLQNM